MRLRRRHEVRVHLRPAGPESPVPGDLDVTCAPTGRVIISASPDDAATLAGRDGFGDREALQDELRERIARAWYAAGCPPRKAAA